MESHISRGFLDLQLPRPSFFIRSQRHTPHSLYSLEKSKNPIESSTFLRPILSFGSHQAESIPSYIYPLIKDMSTANSWPRRNTGPRNQEGGKSPPDPPPYYLHDLKSPGGVNSSDPWHSNRPAVSPVQTFDFTTYKPQPGIRLIDKRGTDIEGETLPLHLRKPHKSSRDGSWPRLSAALIKFSRSEPFWLGLYFLFNLGLTLYNKVVLVTFPFPYTLTAMHALCGSIGCYVLQEYGFYVS
jgi:hypothetical protein